jgi:heptosyltransferase-2
MAIPAARLLYERGFEIEWVCGRAVRPLLECYSWIKLIPADDKAILRGRPLEMVLGIAALWRKLVFKRYDLCATLYYDRRYSLLTLPIWAQRKFKLSRRSRTEAMLSGRHHTDELVRLLLEMEDSCQEKSTSPVRPDRLPTSLLHAKVASRRVAIVPAGASNLLRKQILRRWPIESYVALAHQLVERGWEVILLGGPEDAWVKTHFERLSVTDCVGTLSLPEVISACDTCDAVVSHDTGPMHLAGLSRACVVGIYGPTDPAMFLPRREFVVGLWGGQGFACRPCYDGTDFAPCQFNGCMHQVTVEMVLRELDRLLYSRGQNILSPWRIAFPYEAF